MQVLAYAASRPVPFHSAIMQSTALEPGMASDISFNATAAIAVMAGCLDSSFSFDFTPNSPSQSLDVISCLRSMPMETLLNITNTVSAQSSAVNDGDIFLPTVDQDFLPALASSLILSGRFPKLPLIIGWEENDATLFTPPSINTPTDTRAFISLYYPYLNSGTLSTLLDLYPSTGFVANVAASRSAEFYRSAEILRDIVFVCPSFLFGSGMAKKYSTSQTSPKSNPDCAGPPVYLFANNQTVIANFFSSINLTGLGIPHGSELSYLYADLSLSNFTNLGLPGYTFSPTASDYTLAKRMPRSWTGFAWADNPSLDGMDTLPGWTSAYPEVRTDGMGDVYVIGGGHEGMAGIDGEHNSDIRQEILRQRCMFLNSAAVVKQLKY